jgi:E3 ubiquitin-protein ligase MYCBP2
VAENILNLTKLEDSHRTPSECLHTPTLWLALASLCVLDSEHVERLSSGQWSGTADGQPAPPRVNFMFSCEKLITNQFHAHRA